jgi:hypothetical protein
MTSFLLDLWHDLRAKRLWPVAALLLVALVAVPVVMLRPADEESAAPAQSAQPPAGVEAAVAQLTNDDQSEPSDLDVLDPKDPFRPRGGYGSGTPGLGESTAVGSAGAGSAAPGAGTEPAPTAPSTPIDGGDGTSAPTVPAPAFLKLTVDVEFGLRGGDPKRRRSLDQLQPLPHRKRPLIVFLGVTKRHQAVFSLDTELIPKGEGFCRPSPRRCLRLYLSTTKKHNRHFFRDFDDNQFVLRLLKVNSERVAEAPDLSGRISDLPRNRSRR